MSIRARIFALVAVFAAMALAITALGLVTIAQYRDMIGEYGRAYEHTYDIERLNHLVSNVVMESRGIYSARNQAEANDFAGKLTGNLDAMELLLADWRTSKDPDDRARLKTTEPLVGKFISVRRNLAALATQRRIEEARALGLTDRADRIRFQSHLDGLVADSRKELTASQDRTAAFNADRTITFLLAALLAIVVISVVSLWLIVNFINKPLRHLAGTIIGLSEGQLDTPVPDTDGQDELAQVWRAVARLKAHAIEAEAVIEAQREADRQILLD
ncbi:HAMP domain-containing protein [Asticcacaulis sp. BYS171W]|uniref:HAMP domain-containing protein n=1 Tax=Asticcacaulis aquaticus TaxID=2984212 RepID=A0ABT5HQQ4_9CAUL|nr:HAMP domain-containing protein [Asticcacaulis aquaticus]MDC7682408.1 HAMP domain-containing protein [Asticcacaulis aquaticus]